MIDISLFSDTLQAQIAWGFSAVKERILEELWRKEYNLFRCVKIENFEYCKSQTDDPDKNSIELAKYLVKTYNLDKKQIFFARNVRMYGTCIIGFVVDDCIVYMVHESNFQTMDIINDMIRDKDRQYRSKICKQ